jgi:hypothetical protein
MLRHDPPRGKHDQIHSCHPGFASRTGEHCVDGRVWVVEGDRVDTVEQLQVVLIRSIVAVPSHYIERRVGQSGREQLILKFADGYMAGRHILESSHRVSEVARVSEAIGADGTEQRQLEMAFE